MHLIRRAMLLCLLAAIAANAQQPDSVRRKATADSIAKARQDSIALQRELEKAMAQPSTPTPIRAPTQIVGPTNPRLLPDVSAVGDFVGDLSPKGSTQEDLTRLRVREVELAFQAVVDPYFRGDIFLGLSDVEKVSIEQAFLTTTSLRDLEIRLGRYLAPFGKENTVHRHDLHTVEYPWVIQRFLSPDALKATGAYASRVFAPFGFYQEVQLTVADRLGEQPEDLRPVAPLNKNLNGMMFLGRFRNYWDFTQNTNVELSASALTGRVEQPIFVSTPLVSGGAFEMATSPVNAIGARQSLLGVDFTYRWRPLQQGLYRSFLLQSEFMYQINENITVVPSCAVLGLTLAQCATTAFGGPGRDFSGAYVFTRWQITTRGFLGARYDWVQDPVDPAGTGRNLMAGSGYFEWYPSEFSKLVAAYERLNQPGIDGINRIMLQASFALGPHKPHPF
ncbi:MAG TPA: hypothetical protein VH539_25050 [Gemmatimonadaceae bacterium]